MGQIGPEGPNMHLVCLLVWLISDQVFVFLYFCISVFPPQGPKFVSDEEIERIKAKIEEDNKAIAALDIKNERKYGKKIRKYGKQIRKYGKQIRNMVNKYQTSNFCWHNIFENLHYRTTFVKKHQYAILSSLTPKCFQISDKSKLIYMYFLFYSAPC